MFNHFPYGNAAKMCTAPENPIFMQKFAMSATPVYFIVYQARIIWCEQIFVLYEFFVRGYHCIKLRKRKKKGQLLSDVSHDSPVGVLLFSCCLFQLCFAITVIQVTGFFGGCAACFQYIIC